jgi:protein TonB
MDMRIPLVFATVGPDRAPRPDAGARRVALVAAALLHAGLIAAILMYSPMQQTLAKAAPMVVRLIALDPPPVVPPRPVPPRPSVLPVLPRAVEVAPRPPLAAPTPPIESAVVVPSPTVITVPRSVDPPAPPAPTSVPEVVPPRFDAAYLDNPAPAYPPLARRAGEQGRVLLRVHVTSDGRADDVHVRETSGSPRLDAAAQDTVRQWRVVPARQGDQAVAAWVLVPITFSLAR